MKFKIEGKKGGIASTLLDYWSYLIFVLVIILFFTFFKFQAGDTTKNEITGLTSQVYEDITLLTYLKTPVEIELGGINQNINIAELIRLWYLNQGNDQSTIETAIIDILDLDKGKYQSLLEEKTENILNFWEYKTTNPYADNIIVRTFSIIIMEEEPKGESINPILKIESKNYNIPDTGIGRLNLGQVIIPISNSKNLYIILRRGFVDKSIAK